MSVSDHRDFITREVSNGKSFQEIADIIGVCRQAVSTFCHRQGILKPDSLIPRVKRVCKNCGQEAKSKYARVFCSVSCSAIWNNRNSTGHKLRLEKATQPRYCPECSSNMIKRSKGWRCPNCSISYLKDTIRYKTLAEIMRLNKNAHSRIRSHARHVFYGSNPDMKCFRCGYDTFIEVCHIRAIKSFSPDSLIQEINDLSNLIGLCPNCHWEYDHGRWNL